VAPVTIAEGMFKVEAKNKDSRLYVATEPFCARAAGAPSRAIVDHYYVNPITNSEIAAEISKVWPLTSPERSH
jgi:hypothetical protein